MEYPCTPWSILQKNCNYKDRPEELQELQEADRPFLKLTKQVFESQTKRRAHALAENPASAQSQREPEIMRLRSQWFETTACLCMFGLVGRDGFPMQKRVRFIATHRFFIDELNVQCDRLHQHQAVAGSNTALSACCPLYYLADAICRAYWRIAEQEDFGTMAYDEPKDTKTACYVYIDRRESEQRPILDAAAGRCCGSASSKSSSQHLRRTRFRALRQDCSLTALADHEHPVGTPSKGEEDTRRTA